MIKKIFRMITIFTMLTAFTVSATGCGSENASSKAASKTENAAQSSDLKIVRIGTVGQGSTLTDCAGIAQNLGYLEEELEKVGYIPQVEGFAQAGPAINEAFSAGNLDMAVYGDLPATTCKASGVDTTIFATSNAECNMGILVQKDSDIKSAADLRGHKVIVARGTIYHQYFETVIETEGIEASEIQQINTFSDASAVMSSGDADALITSTSIAYYLESQGIGKVISSSEGDPTLTSQFFAVGKTEFLEANPEVAKAFIRALLRAQEFASEKTEETYQKLAELTEGYTNDIYEKVYEYDTSFDYFSPEITQEGMQKLEVLEQFMEEKELISAPVDMKSFVNTTYYEEVMQEIEDSDK